MEIHGQVLFVERCKFAFVGAPSTGKTTTFNALLASKWAIDHDLFGVQEIARFCPYPLGEEANQQSQVWLLTEQMRQEMHFSQDYPFVMYDRSVFDCAVFAKVLCLWPGDAAAVFSLALSWHKLKPYQLLFWFRPKWCVQNMLQKGSELFQRRIDDCFSDLFVKLQTFEPCLHVMEVTAGSVAERVCFVQEKLTDLCQV